MMLIDEKARQLLADAELIVPADVLTSTIHGMAKAITAELSNQYPLVLSVMNGAIVFTGQILPLLNFPLDFDYLHVTRYNRALRGGSIRWETLPRIDLTGRVVLVLDDVLDEGLTLAAIRQRLMEAGAKAFYSAVLVDKLIDREKPVYADFVGISLPDRYIFGYGMDVHGIWRNLPAIYAMKA